MKKIFTIALAVLFISCEQNTEELNQLRAEKEYVENNVQMYTRDRKSTRLNSSH